MEGYALLLLDSIALGPYLLFYKSIVHSSRLPPTQKIFSRTSGRVTYQKPQTSCFAWAWALLTWFYSICGTVIGGPILQQNVECLILSTLRSSVNKLSVPIPLGNTLCGCTQSASRSWRVVYSCCCLNYHKEKKIDEVAWSTFDYRLSHKHQRFIVALNYIVRTM